MKIVKIILLSSLIVFVLALTLAALEFRGLVRDARLSVRMSDTTLGHLNDTAFETAKMAKSLAGATDAEAGKLQATTEEARKTGRAARALLDSGRQVLIDMHQQVVPGLNKTISDLDANQNALMGKLNPSLDNLATASESAAKTLSDPSIKVTLDNIEMATYSGKQSLEHVEGITGAGQRTAEYYEKRLTTPQSFFKTLLQFILDSGSKARILFNR